MWEWWRGKRVTCMRLCMGMLAMPLAITFLVLVWLPIPRHNVRFFLQDTQLSAISEELGEQLSLLLPQSLPLISAVVPCYNYGGMVLTAVKSLQAQTYPYVEIIVVDDGSTDPITLAALDSLRKEEGDSKEKPVWVYRKTNGGLASARNYGASKAKGEYILFLDNDDTLEPLAMVLLFLKLYQSPPEVGFSYPSQWFVGETNLVWNPQEYNHYDLLWANHPTVCALLRRSVMEKWEYSETLQNGPEDWHFWTSLAERGIYGTLVPVPLFKYMRHGETMAHKVRETMQQHYYPFLVSEKRWTSFDVDKIYQVKLRWRPLISVIVPYKYNPDTPHWFNETLDSILRQSNDDFELVIVEDGTRPAGAPDLLAHLVPASSSSSESKMPFITVIRNKEAKGVSAVRNQAAIGGRGNYLFFLDADDKIDPWCLEKMVLAALNLGDEGRSVSYIYSGVLHFGKFNNTVVTPWDRAALLRSNFLTVSALIRRKDFLHIGGFDPKYDLLEDYDMWLRFLAHGREGELVPEPLFHYRRHLLGRTKKNSAVPMEEMMESLRQRNPKAFDSKFPKVYLPQYRPIGVPKLSLLDDVINKYAQLYHTMIGATVKYDSYRRGNTLNVFQRRWWQAVASNHSKGTSYPRSLGDSSGSNLVHVLYLTPYTVLGGAEYHDLQILRGLRKSGRFWLTVVVELSSGSNEVLRDEFEATSDELFYLGNLMPNVQDERALWTVEYLMISRRVDVVFNRNTYVGYKLAELARRYNKYTQVRMVDLIHLYEPVHGAWERYSAPYHGMMDERFVSSRDVIDYIATKYRLPSEDFTLIYGGVDLRTWNRTKVWDDKTPYLGLFTSRVGADKPWRVVGYNGRLVEQKRPLLWLEAAQHVAIAEDDVLFVMIGEGGMKQEVENKVAELGEPLASRIRFLGRIDAAMLPRYVSQFDVLLMTSSFEGIPGVLIECLALGVAVVAPDIGGIRECVDSSTGILLPVNSTAGEFGDAVLSLLRETPEQKEVRNEKAMTKARERFDQDWMQVAYVNRLLRLGKLVDHEAMYREYLVRVLEYPLFTMPRQYWEEKFSKTPKNANNETKMQQETTGAASSGSPFGEDGIEWVDPLLNGEAKSEVVEQSSLLMKLLLYGKTSLW